MSTLPSGTTTAQAKQIQRALCEKTNSSMTIDGQFGPNSVSVLRNFQFQNKIPVTGIYDAATQALLGPFIAAKYLGPSAYAQAAQGLGTDAATVQVVCQVETSGAGFFNNGQCTILFERAQMFRALNTVLPAAQVNTLAAQYPDLINSQTGGYLGGAAEWNRLQQAQAVLEVAGVNPDLALRCASWGLFQIMGYYYVQCGFPNVEAFTNAMCVNETNQLEAFVNYIKDMNGGAELAALKAHNWTSFANQYNGSNQHAQNNYDGKLAAAYQALTGHA